MLGVFRRRCLKSTDSDLSPRVKAHFNCERAFYRQRLNKTGVSQATFLNCMQHGFMTASHILRSAQYTSPNSEEVFVSLYIRTLGDLVTFHSPRCH